MHLLLNRARFLQKSLNLIRLVNLLDVQNVVVALDFFVSTLRYDLSSVHDDNLVREVDKLDSVGYKDSCAVFEQALEDLFEDLFASAGVKC